MHADDVSLPVVLIEPVHFRMLEVPKLSFMLRHFTKILVDEIVCYFPCRIILYVNLFTERMHVRMHALFNFLEVKYGVED